MIPTNMATTACNQGLAMIIVSTKKVSKNQYAKAIMGSGGIFFHMNLSNQTIK